MIQSYKCPGCSASLQYKEGTDVLHCPYCGRTVSIDEAARKAKEDTDREDEERRDTEASDPDGDGVQQFHCESCGGELVTDRFTAATICPFCGSPSIIKSRLSGNRKPQVLIPFGISKEEAKGIFRKWTKSGFLTPRAFSSVSTLDSIKGIYVPYWLFSFHSTASLVASATRVRTEIRGKYEYTYTDHFRLSRETENDYRRSPADASEEMPDDIMERLEPFDYTKLTSFELPYLSGFLAECSNFDPEALQPRVEERASKAIYGETMSTMNGYSSVTVTQSRIDHQKSAQEYAMFPLWLLQYRYRGKNWQLFLNGETGRKIGNLPVDKIKAAILFLLSSAAATGIAGLVWHMFI